MYPFGFGGGGFDNFSEDSFFEGGSHPYRNQVVKVLIFEVLCR
jgi:hypothetical protein